MLADFAKSQKGDQVFCYQIDEGRYVALCEVKVKESKAPGGRCLVLANVRLLHLVEVFGPKGTIHPLLEEEARALCKRCGLHGLPDYALTERGRILGT